MGRSDYPRRISHGRNLSIFRRCRGHFRDYREGRGLFGKYKQLVWTPMGLRGGREKGEKTPAREMEIKV